VERLSARERERVAELVAEGAPFWRLLQEVPRSRYAINRAVKRLKRPPAREPIRSPLRRRPPRRRQRGEDRHRRRRGASTGPCARSFSPGRPSTRSRMRKRSSTCGSSTTTTSGLTRASGWSRPSSGSGSPGPGRPPSSSRGPRRSTVEISIGEELIRVHRIRHDRTREHGALANPGGRLRRINAA
jgi:hypothetical protein